jgi:hypothetical protein
LVSIADAADPFYALAALLGEATLFAHETTNGHAVTEQATLAVEAMS